MKSREDYKKFFIKGTNHMIKELSNEELAQYVDALFLKNSEHPQRNIDERFQYSLLKKEIAYQVIRKLVSEKTKINGLIQTEEDWKRYFQLEN